MPDLVCSSRPRWPLALLAAAAGAAAADIVPGRVIVKYRDGTSRRAPGRDPEAVGAQTQASLPGGSKQRAGAGRPVGPARPRPSCAPTRTSPTRSPTTSRHAASPVPATRRLAACSGTSSGPSASTCRDGVEHRSPRSARPAGGASIVAVLDTGVAYRDFGRFRRAPDLARHFVRGYDFVDGDQPPGRRERPRHPRRRHDRARAQQQASARPGIAYGAKIMPVRVLDSQRRRRRHRHRPRHPLRRPPRRRRDQPQPRVRLAGTRVPQIPDVAARASLRTHARRRRGRRGRQPGRHAGRLPGTRRRRDRGRRHHRARLRGRLLERRPRRRRRRARRRRRRAQ